MLTTTLNKIHAAGACVKGYEKLINHVGLHYDHDAPINLTTVLESNGLQDTIWCFRCTNESSENILIEFACRCAEHVLHFYEDKYPDDKRPRQAIEAGRRCVVDKSPTARAAARAAGDAAGDAAWAARAAAWVAGAAAGAAGAAAWAAGNAARAARDAAWAARAAAWDARAAENQWQIETLKQLLSGQNET